MYRYEVEWWNRRIIFVLRSNKQVWRLFRPQFNNLKRISCPIKKSIGRRLSGIFCKIFILRFIKWETNLDENHNIRIRLISVACVKTFNKSKKHFCIESEEKPISNLYFCPFFFCFSLNNRTFCGFWPIIINFRWK